MKNSFLEGLLQDPRGILAARRGWKSGSPDDARIGQKRTLARVWAARGRRPRAMRDQRYRSLYLFDAICPERNVGAGLVLPYLNTQAMRLHLATIAEQVAADTMPSSCSTTRGSPL